MEARLLLATYSFRNASSINFPEDANPPTPASLYPSAITVNGLTGQIGALQVTLYGFHHDRPNDVDVLLVGPGGRSVVLMSDAGGATLPTRGIDLIFSDGATRDVPELTRPGSGLLYRPTNYAPDDVFPGDAPADAPTHANLQGLAADSPNGTWRLFAVDDTAGNVGGFSNGWGLTLTMAGPDAPSVPDLYWTHDSGASDFDDITNRSTPLFTGRAAGAAQVRLYVDGVASAVAPVGAEGNWEAAPDTPLADGTYAITAAAIADGIEGERSAALTMTVDTLPPVPGVPDLTPASDTGASNSDDDSDDWTPTFVGTAPGATTVTLFADGNLVGNGFVFDGVYAVTPSRPLGPGTYQFSVGAADVAGNDSEPTSGLPVVIRPSALPPVVTDVYVRGSTWFGQDNNGAHTTFMEFLKARGLGDDLLGYHLFRSDRRPPPQNPDDILPWINLNEIVIRYNAASGGASGPPMVSVGGLRRSESFIRTEPIPGDPTSFVARLNEPLGGGNPATGAAPTGAENGDRVTLRVPGGGPGGSNFAFTMKVLQGDVDHVNEAAHNVLARDFAEVKKRFFKNTHSVPSNPDTDYSPFHDINGDGQILATDYAAVKKRFFHTLPAAAPPEPTPLGGTRVAEDVLA